MLSKLKFDKKIITVFSLFLFLGIVSFWKFSQDPNKKRDLTSYTSYAIKGSLPGLINANGELQPQKTVNISPKRQGIIKYIYADAGEIVEEGQLLAKMDEGDLIYRINELKADFEKEKANYERRKFLYEEGAISKEKHDEYKNLFLKSKARLKQRELEKEELNVFAPFQGLITSRYAIPGAFVTPTTSASSNSNGSINSNSIFELSQGLEAIAKVPESDIGRIQIGQKANIRVDSFPEKRFEARVIEISPRAIKSNNVTSFEVTLSLINSPTQLRLGMTSDIEFQTGATPMRTLVPTVAIVTRDGVPGLFFVGKNSQPKFKRIELGTSSGDKTAIIKGLNPGDQIFIDLPPWTKEPRN
tara:strand:- start:159 stop:1232 length:1074 start_codon:yes stop_codon:yes gene_type:complete